MNGAALALLPACWPPRRQPAAAEPPGVRAGSGVGPPPTDRRHQRRAGRLERTGRAPGHGHGHGTQCSPFWTRLWASGAVPRSPHSDRIRPTGAPGRRAPRAASDSVSSATRPIINQTAADCHNHSRGPLCNQSSACHRATRGGGGGRVGGRS